MESHPRLGGKQQPHRPVDALARHAARAHRDLHRVDGVAHILRYEEHVGARFQRQHRRLARAVSTRDGAHAQGIREDQAVEPHVLAQEFGQEVGRERRRHVVAQDGGHRDVGRHHRVHAGRHGPPEGHQLHRLQALPVRGHDRELDVRVGAGVTVTWKVLRRGEHAALSRALDVRRPQPRHRLRVLAEGTGVDDGVLGIRVDVENRGEVQVHAESARLHRRDAPVFVGEGRIADGPEGHRGREAGATALGEQGGKRVGVVDAHPRAAVLEVRGDQQRNAGGILEPVQERSVGVGQADRDDDPSDPVLRHPSLQRAEACVARRGVPAGDPGNHELRNALAQGERGERLIHPCTRPAVEFIVIEGRRRSLRSAGVLSRALAGCRDSEQEEQPDGPRPSDGNLDPSWSRPCGMNPPWRRPCRLHPPCVLHAPHLPLTGNWIPSPISKKDGRPVGVRPRMGISPKSARAAAIWLTSDALQASM